MRVIGITLSLLLLLIDLSSALAHRQKTIFTTISYNPRTQALEIIHQAYAHDVEHAFGNRIQLESGLDNIRAQALVSLELSKSFKLWNEQGDEIPLSLVGAELEADLFYIYQEADLPAIPKSMQIEHGILRNYWPDMQNYINVNYGESIRSLIFSGNDGKKLLSSDR